MVATRASTPAARQQEWLLAFPAAQVVSALERAAGFCLEQAWEWELAFFAG
jgi:hypothetical protein